MTTKRVIALIMSVSTTVVRRQVLLSCFPPLRNDVCGDWSGASSPTITKARYIPALIKGGALRHPVVLNMVVCMISPLSKTIAYTPGSNLIGLLSEGRSRRSIFGVGTPPNSLPYAPRKTLSAPLFSAPRRVEKSGPYAP